MYLQLQEVSWRAHKNLESIRGKVHLVVGFGDQEALGLLSKIRKVAIWRLIGHAIVVVVLLLEMLV